MSLENLCLRLDILQEETPCSQTKPKCSITRKAENDATTLQDDEIVNSESPVSCHSIPMDNLKSFAVVFSNGSGYLSDQMEKLIRQVIRGIKCDELRSFWTPLAPATLDSIVCSVQANQLVAWKQIHRHTMYRDGSFLPSDLNAATSLVWNTYMQKGVFNSPNMQKVECGFWKDVTIRLKICL